MKFYIIVFTLFFLSCQAKPKKNKVVEKLNIEQPEIKYDKEFYLYLKNFKNFKLPIIIKGCEIDDIEFSKFDPDKFSKYCDENFIAYGKFQTNGNYIATITLGAADCYLPVLTTFKPSGQKIDQATIAIGGCGMDCGFTCEEYMTLKRDFTFYTSDTISTYECDSLGNETPGTFKYYVQYKKGKLLKNGKIEISNELTKPLKRKKNTP